MDFKLAEIVRGTPFVLATMFVVLVNTAFLMVDHADQSDQTDDVLRIGNYVFIGIFVVELLFKLWALGATQYWSSKFNRFDAFVVFLRWVEVYPPCIWLRPC